MAVAAPTAQIVSIEFNTANAEIARRILDHAGVSTRVTIVVGTLDDGGKTIDALRTEHGLGVGSVDLVFIPRQRGLLARLAAHPRTELVATKRLGRG